MTFPELCLNRPSSHSTFLRIIRCSFSGAITYRVARIYYYTVLTYFFNIKKCLAHDTSSADINAVNSHEGIGNRLAAICQERVGETVGNDLNGHAGFDTDAVDL